MDNRAAKSGGAEISRKTRSLDIRSLYKSKKEGSNKRKSRVEYDSEVREEKRKNRKEVLLSSFGSVDNKSRNSLDEFYGDEASPDSSGLERSQSGLSQKLDRSSGFNSILLNFDNSGNVILIPKRPRDFVGRKKFESSQVLRPLSSSSRVGGSDQTATLNSECKKLEGDQVSKRLGPSGGKSNSANQMAKLNRDSSGKVVSPKVKGKSGSDDLMENRTSRVSSARHDKEKDAHSIVNNDDESCRKRRSNHRKRKDLASGSESLAKKVRPLADSSIRKCDDSPNEEEENLEQNAARMLSSRFDPSCTGFSSKCISSGSPSTNGLSFFVPSEEDFVSQGVSLESESVDTASRVLRPRKQHKEKGLLRKRRHFYEILSIDMDAYWVLDRRIKVFWPLDESWYYGIVIDYDPERKLHHIKYDDRDEEWINLQNERIKLLLLPSEVPHKTEPKRATRGNKHVDREERDFTTYDDSFIGSYMDSEPIISWLARSSRRIKSSPLGVSKRRRTSNLSPNIVPLVLPTKSDDAHGCLDTGSPERDVDKLYCSSVLTDRFTVSCRGKKSMLVGTSSSEDGKSPVVYFRKRFRKKGGGLFNALWSVDDRGLLRLTIPLVESKKLRFELVSPFPVLGFTFGAENSWLLRSLLLLQFGTITITWPKVQLEMLFVDNIFGFRFLLFEGCLKQVVAFVSLVLTVFNQPKEHGKYVGVHMPVTSIRFRLSCIEDLRKQHMFAFYSFSTLKESKWLYLDCELQRHCLLSEQLPLSESTTNYNIKALEGGSNQLAISSSCKEGLRKKSMHGNMSVGAFRECCNIAVNQSFSNSDGRRGKLIPFALSFAAAPTFLFSLHLKLLMENSVASASSTYSLEHFEGSGCPVPDAYTLIRDCSKNNSEINLEGNQGTSLRKDESSRWLSCAKTQLGTETLSECNAGGWVKSFVNSDDGKLNVAGTSVCCRDPGENASDIIVESQKRGCSSPESEEFVTTPQLLVPKDHGSVDVSDARCYSGLTGLSVEIPSLYQVERPVVKTPNAVQSSVLAWNLSDSTVCSPSPTGPRSSWHRNRNSSSSSFGDASQVWPDGTADFIPNGFGSGPRKPRTQVQYTLPFGGFDFSSSKHKLHNQRGLPYQRIRKANEKRTSDGSRNSHKNLELLACDANVLITSGDRGWRECEARVVLELGDHNEWSLAVKLSGTTKYLYKAHQFLQPGSTNRYTHAMIWKGGKDWVLEFPDRSQWMLFKEMHQECYNRNIRAALVKNIPIPGVRLIEESGDNVIEVPFVCSSPKYFRQVETDVDMALDPSHILYDMDSDDEQWISETQESSHGHGSAWEEISEELFEKTMDMFEKVAYAQQRDNFTDDEIEEFMAGVGPMEAIKTIHEHWRLKRQRKGMPLIRHLQPPLWERYEQQVKEWEQTMANQNSTLSNGFPGKAPPMEKPPVFAFCMKSRGLEMPNKGSKQRPQRRFPVSGHSHAVLSDQDGPRAFGRRSNEYTFGHERVIFQGNSHEPSDASPSFQASSRLFSPRDGSVFSLSSDWSEWNHDSQLNWNKSKKIGALLSPNNAQMVTSSNQRTIGKRNGVHWSSMGLPEWPSQKHYQSEVSLRRGIEQLDSSDLDEFRLLDASGAAQHALNMARLKREKAQRLLYRADLAIHKAVVALTTAEAIKTSFEDSNSDG